MSAVVADVLAETGVIVSVGIGVDRVSLDGARTVLHLSDGTEVRGDRLLVATGRRPRIKGYGLETLGIDVSSGAIPTGSDARVVGQSNVYAAGDVTGRFPFTHTANYAGRVVAANVQGQSARDAPGRRAAWGLHRPAGCRRRPVGRPGEEKGRTVVRATMDIGGTARGWLESETGVARADG